MTINPHHTSVLSDIDDNEGRFMVITVTVAILIVIMIVMIRKSE